MIIIDPSFKVLDNINGEEIIKKIEFAGRICYKSNENITPDSARTFVLKIIKSGHESVIEHEKISVLIVCDRGVSHEIVRHRIASYSQESTRYCNYSNDKFGAEITVIKPCFWEVNSELYEQWLQSVSFSEKMYMSMIKNGASPQEARSVLPNSLKTEIVVSMNLREWRHFLKLRTANNAHPQMQQISRPLLDCLKKIIPVIFDDISY